MSSYPVVSFADVIRHAVQRVRLARQPVLEQAQLAKRMASLGYPWHPQTVSNVERGKRRVTAEELLGLSLALEIPLSYLLTPYGGMTPAPAVSMPGGEVLPSLLSASVGAGEYEKWLTWSDDDEAVWPDRETVEQRWRLDDELRRAEATAVKAHWELLDALADQDPSEEEKRQRLLEAEQRVRNLRSVIDQLRREAAGLPVEDPWTKSTDSKDEGDA